MMLDFCKMHGLGNDFMVVDLLRQDAQFRPDTVRALANRRTGVGFDQLLLIEAPSDPDCDFRYRIYNADGSEAEHCGNGSRCIARFVMDKGLAFGQRIRLQMASGSIETRILDNGLVTVDMGAPQLDPAAIPFAAITQAVVYPLHLAATGQTLEISALAMGNPHAVLLSDDIHTAPVAALGPLIECHPDFPRRVNAGFMQVLNRGRIQLRVFERGAGETSACGTGACAAVVAGQLRGLLDHRVTVVLTGGELDIEWQGGNSPVLMTGPAVTVFDGKIDYRLMSAGTSI
ncbi:MAG: diaminopimelate epimerase [Pseudomonadales bacterium]|nr:diaminopimelate epimerase [Pseudomonadales bacterium]